MISAYNSGSVAVIETVYTYEEWLKEYSRREAKWRIRQRIDHIYYMKQRLSGLILLIIGMMVPLIDGDATVSLFALPLGIFLVLTEKHVMTF